MSPKAMQPSPINRLQATLPEPLTVVEKSVRCQL